MIIMLRKIALLLIVVVLSTCGTEEEMPNALDGNELKTSQLVIRLTDAPN